MATTAAPTEAVQAAQVAGNVVHDLSMWGLFMQADFVVKAVMIMLLVASLWSWAIIFDKWMRLRSVRWRGERFQDALWSSDDLDKFYRKAEKREEHPMANVFASAMKEWYRFRQNQVNDVHTRSSVKERIYQIMQLTRNRELDDLERHLGFLATVGSTAPFVGLFGTVWGIMNSFQAIAMSKNTSLAVVAPGIAEALFATAVGLFAAIPAVIFYNKFNNEIARIAGLLEDFSLEFGTLVSRYLDAPQGMPANQQQQAFAANRGGF